MTITRNRIIALLLAASLIVLIPTAVRSDNSQNAITIRTVSVNKIGECEVIGYIDTYKAGAQVSFLSINKNNTKELVPDDFIHINQCRTGNNGTFLFKFQIPEKFSGQKVYIFINSNQKTTLVSTTYNVPELPPGIDVVGNNSVMYGKDIYYVPSPFHNADNVAESISYGGNIIYFKLGGYWYNLLDGRATSNSFLIPENATDNNTIETIKPRMYYMTARTVKLKYQ